MEKFIEAHCKYFNMLFDKVIQQYNSNTKNGRSIDYIVDYIIGYKIENNKNIIYKEDIPKICSIYFGQNISQEEFMEKVIERIKRYNLDINNLTMRNVFYSFY
jgi:hypothetical protein